MLMSTLFVTIQKVLVTITDFMYLCRIVKNDLAIKHLLQKMKRISKKLHNILFATWVCRKVCSPFSFSTS